MACESWVNAVVNPTVSFDAPEWYACPAAAATSYAFVAAARGARTDAGNGPAVLSHVAVTVSNVTVAGNPASEQDSQVRTETMAA